jgi:hypothetical protein
VQCYVIAARMPTCSLLFDKVSQEAATTNDTSSNTNDDSTTQQHSSSSSTSSVTLAVATGHRKSISMASALQQQQLTPTARCAYLVMSDLCTLSRGESGRWYVYYTHILLLHIVMTYINRAACMYMSSLHTMRCSFISLLQPVGLCTYTEFGY